MKYGYDNVEDAKAANGGKMGKISKVLGPTFVGVDAISRIKDGESAPVAITKALATNAAFGLIPGGMIGSIAAMAGVAAIQAAPAISRAIDSKTSKMGQKGVGFAGANKFIGSEAQENMLEQGLSQMNQATNPSTNAGMKKLMGQARNAHNTY